MELAVLRCPLLTPLFCLPKEGSTIHWCTKAVKVGKWEKQEGRGTARTCFRGGLGWVILSRAGQNWIMYFDELVTPAIPAHIWGIRKRFNFSSSGKLQSRGLLNYSCSNPGFTCFPIFYNGLDLGSPPHWNACNAFYTWLFLQNSEMSLRFLEKVQYLSTQKLY